MRASCGRPSHRIFRQQFVSVGTVDPLHLTGHIGAVSLDDKLIQEAAVDGWDKSIRDTYLSYDETTIPFPEDVDSRPGRGGNGGLFRLDLRLCWGLVR